MKNNTSNAGSNAQTAYRNVRAKPRETTREPVIISASFNSTLVIPVKILFCHLSISTATGALFDEGICNAQWSFVARIAVEKPTTPASVALEQTQ